MCAGGLRKKPLLCEVLTKPLSRCGERSHCEDREDALEYADTRSEGSYHPPKVAEENVVEGHDEGEEQSVLTGSNTTIY